MVASMDACTTRLQRCAVRAAAGTVRVPAGVRPQLVAGLPTAHPLTMDAEWPRQVKMRSLQPPCSTRPPTVPLAAGRCTLRARCPPSRLSSTRDGLVPLCVAGSGGRRQKQEQEQ